MADNSLTRKSARELARLIRTRAVSPVEVLDAHLAAIEALNPKLNAIVTLAAEQARDAARRGGSRRHERRAARPAARPAGRHQGRHHHRRHPHHLRLAALTRTMCRTRTPKPCAASRPPAPSCSPRPTRRNSPAAPTPTTCCSARPAIRGIRRLSPAGSSGGSAVAVATGMVPIAQGTDFGCSIRIPAAFCGIVGIRPTPGLTPSYPMPLAWDPGQVHGPLARDAEDAALMLDAMVGFTRLSPISVAPPWQSALAELERRDGHQRACASPTSPTSPASASMPKSTRSAATPRPRSSKLGAQVEADRIRRRRRTRAYQTWRGFWMVGQQYERLEQIDQFGPNLQGQCRGRAETERARFRRGRATRAGGFSSLPRTVRALRHSADAGRAGEAVSGRAEFPRPDQRPSFENYIDWIAPAFLITLVSLPAASAPAGLSRELPVGMQIVAPRFEEPLILRVARANSPGEQVGWPPLAAGLNTLAPGRGKRRHGLARSPS